MPLVPPDFHLTQMLEDAFRQHPKAIILCNLSNPCGKVFTREELGDYRVSRGEVRYLALSPMRCMSISYSHPTTSTLILPPCRACGSARCRAVALQDVFRHRLATGLYHRAAGDHRPREKRCMISDLSAWQHLQEAVVTGLKMGQDYYDDLQAKYTQKNGAVLVLSGRS